MLKGFQNNEETKQERIQNNNESDSTRNTNNRTTRIHNKPNNTNNIKKKNYQVITVFKK